MSGEASLRVALVQLEPSNALPDATLLRATGARVRTAMCAAAESGARLVVFPEATMMYPGKRIISRLAPNLDGADWTKADWGAQRDELEQVASLSRELGLWTVVGGLHWLSADRRPHNSLYVFSDQGLLVTRYDKRRISQNELTYLFTPGTEPVAFDVHGFRIGLVVCLETLFPDYFVEYADNDVDLVVIASAGGGIFGQLAQTYAAITGMTIGLAVAVTPDPDPAKTGACGPYGWLDRIEDNEPGMVVVDVAKCDGASSFHRRARRGLYDSAIDRTEPRSLDRQTL
jgi:predicted amidohydrolase